MNRLARPARLALTVLAALAPAALGQAAPAGEGPLTIEQLRRGSYPGSALAVERTLTPGANYRRYVVSYRSEGLKINALLTVPNGAAPKGGWPGIVFNHGYIPPAQYRTTERYVAYVDALARQGYVVLKPDLRGHGSSQGEATGAYWSPGYTVDVLNAFASLRRRPGLNPERIGMWGHSMGGYLTLRAMVVDSRIKAGVIWAGVVAPYEDLLQSWAPRYLGGGDRAGGVDARAAMLRRYGTPASNPGFWDSISANNYLSRVGPIQLHHSPADTHVPFAFSQKLAGQLRAAGRTTELYSYANDDHNLTRNFGLAMRRTVAFLDRYLKAR